MTHHLNLQINSNSMLDQTRKRSVALVFAALASLATSLAAQTPATHPPAAPAQTQPWTRIPIPQLHAFKPKEPRRIELANGLVIFLQEDHELPFINGFVLIRGGSRDEPAGKIGMVSLYSQSWRTSGSATTNGDDLDAQLAQKAASIETGGGAGNTSVRWSSLKGDFDSVFGSATELLFHPAFKADKLQLAKRQLASRISRRNDDASSIAGREAIKLVYGAGSPYARLSQYATIAAVTLDDLQAWHDRTVVANNMMIAVSGDFDSAAMEAKLRKVFEPVPRGTRITAPATTFPGPTPGRLLRRQT